MPAVPGLGNQDRQRIDLLFAVLQGRNAVIFFEQPAEMGVVFKPAFKSDIAHRLVGAAQQLAGMRQPFFHQPAMRRHIVGSVKISFE